MDYVVPNAKRHGPPGFGLPRARDMPAMICVPSQRGLSWHRSWAYQPAWRPLLKLHGVDRRRSNARCTMDVVIKYYAGVHS